MRTEKLIFDTLSDYDKAVAIRNAQRACAELANGIAIADLCDDALMSYIILREYDLAVALTEAAKRGPAAVVLQ